MTTSTLEDYKGFLAKLSEKTGLNFTPDESGLVSLRVDDAYTLNLQYVAATSKILCFVDVATLPKTCDKAVYRDLLVGTLFGKDTAGGYFALEGESETVVYNYLFDFDPATTDPAATESVIENILMLVDMWAERIAEQSAGGSPEPSAAEKKDALSKDSFLKV